jgi:hypothetical protein
MGYVCSHLLDIQMLILGLKVTERLGVHHPLQPQKSWKVRLGTSALPHFGGVIGATLHRSSQDRVAPHRCRA